MGLPGEHHDKKECREVGGRMDTGREQRGGEVDKGEKRQERSLSGGWEEEEEEDQDFKAKPPNQQKTQSLKSAVAKPQSRSWW